MKKKTLSSILACVAVGAVGFSLMGASNPIEKLVKEKTGADVKIVKQVPLNQLKDMQVVILESGNQRVPFLADKNGTTLIGADSSFLTSNDNLLLTLQKTVQETDAYNNRSKSDKLLATIKQKNYPVIALQSPTKTNKTLYVVSDPNCPYCQDELGRVEGHLRDKNVKMIVVGLLSEDSLYKASDLYSQIKTAQTNQAKINILRKIYSGNYQASGSQPSRDALGIAEAVRDSGITSVPYKFEVTE